MSEHSRRPQPGGPAPSPNGGPRDLQGTLPDPEAIARQKDVYMNMLDEQLNQGVSVLDQQVKYQRGYLKVQVEQQKKQFLLQLEQQMQAQDMHLTQQYNEQLMALQMQAGQQKAALEQQAMQLSMEYEQRKAEESMYRQQYDIQRQQMEMSMRMAQDYQRMGPLGGQEPRGSYVPAPSGPSPSYQPPWTETREPYPAGAYRNGPPQQAGSFRGPVEPPRRPPSIQSEVMAMPPQTMYYPEQQQSGSYRPAVVEPDMYYRVPNQSHVVSGPQTLPPQSLPPQMLPPQYVTSGSRPTPPSYSEPRPMPPTYSDPRPTPPVYSEPVTILPGEARPPGM